MSLHTQDWKDIVSGVAPALAGVLGGPLAGAAVKILADSVLGKSSTDESVNESDLSKVLAGGLTPELQARILEAENQIKQALIAAETKKLEISAELEKASLADVADARSHNANTIGILRLGYTVNVLSYTLVAAILYGCYEILTIDSLKDIDPSALVAISTLVGGVVQWVMSNAGQANGFFFGSSPSNRFGGAASIGTSLTATAKSLATRARK